MHTEVPIPRLPEAQGLLACKTAQRPADFPQKAPDLDPQNPTIKDEGVLRRKS